MKTLIVSKTKYGQNKYCIGGFIIDTKANVRLLTLNGNFQDTSTRFEIGDYWDVDFFPKTNCVLPHTEDVRVYNQRKIGNEENLKDFLLNNVNYWHGGRSEIFNGIISFDENGKGYLQKYEDKYLPKYSVGFWRLPYDLSFCQIENSQYEKKIRYESCEESENINLPYIGIEDPIDVIPANTLVRLSLARWFDPNNSSQVKCYLNLSGWYLDQHKSQKFNNSQIQDEDLPF